MQIESLAARACVLSESSAPSQIIDGLGSADTLWQGAVAWDLKTVILDRVCCQREGIEGRL